MIGFNPELYSKGSNRLIDEARTSSRAQGFRRGQNTAMRDVNINLIHNPSANIKLRGYTNALQVFKPLLTWNSLGGQRSTSQYRNTLPSINAPTPPSPVPTKMPWNR